MARSPGRREGRLRVGSLSRMFAFRTFAVRSARHHMLRNTALSGCGGVRGTVFRPAGGCGCCRSRGHGAGWSVQTPGAGRRRLRPGPGARPIGRRVSLREGRGCGWQWLPRCAHHALPSPGSGHGAGRPSARSLRCPGAVVTQCGGSMYAEASPASGAQQFSFQRRRVTLHTSQSMVQRHKVVALVIADECALKYFSMTLKKLQ